MRALIPHEAIERKIFLIRGQRVMLDRGLAKLYGVTTKRLNEQVKRNIERFPQDFMFKLTLEEKNELVASCDRFNSMKHSTVLPFVFTEQGVAMLSSVLRSRRAIQVNIAIMRAFVKLKEILSTHKELAHKLEQLERKIEQHDEEISNIFEAIRELMAPPPAKKRRIIGFQPPQKSR